MNRRKTGQLYDPEIGSLLMIVASALGALGGLAGVLAYTEQQIEKREHKRKSEKIKEQAKRETSTSMAEIRYSMSNIRNRMERLFEITNNADNINNSEMPYLHTRMVLGKRPLYLSELHFRRYQMLQDDILLDISRFLRNISILEQLLTEYNDIFRERIHYSRAKVDVHEIMGLVNNLLGSYNERTYEDFIGGVLHICERIESVSRWFSDESYL